MNHQRLVQLACAVVATTSLLGYGALLGLMDGFRHEVSTPGEPLPAQPLPWHMTLAKTSLGPLQGLAVNFLWYRADQLSQENRLFEASQLSQWISSLLPHYPRVWTFHAWNLAYNISVKTYTPQERWDWINRGISLLRDRGIPSNPSVPQLYRELSWIFFHKLGKESDDMHWYYKQQFALQWQELLGQVPMGASTQQTLDAFGPIANAPDSLPALQSRDPAVSALRERLHHLGYQLDEALLRQLGRVEMFRNDPRLRQTSAGINAQTPSLPYDTRLAQLLDEPSLASQVPLLTVFLRKKVLRESYHMDPAFMLKLMEVYGPLDWRHPVCHGVYWSEMGLAKSGRSRDWAQGALQATVGWSSRNTVSAHIPPEPPESPQPPESPETLGAPDAEDLDLLNTNRLAIHSLQQLTRLGQVCFDPLTLQLDLLPDTRFIPAYDLAMDQAKQRIQSGQYGDVSTTSFETGHENFLLQAATFCYLYGQIPEARRYYKKARDLYGSKPENVASGRYKRTLVEQVGLQFRENFPALADTNQFIRAMLGHAFDHGLAQNRLEVFNRFVQMAGRVYRQYQSQQSAQPYTRQDRTRLLPFSQVVDDTYLVYMTSSRSRADLLKRSRVWANTPVAIQQRVADRLLSALAPQAQKAGLDLVRAFPKPPSATELQFSQPSPSPNDFSTQIERQ